MHESLFALGCTDAVLQAFEPFSTDHVLGRIVAEHRGKYVASTTDGDVWAEITGRMRHATTERSELPAAGDWVALQPRQGGDAMVGAVLPRTTAFTRKEAGHRSQGQVLAANVDQVWIVAAMTAELSARRVERFLTVAWDSGAAPVVVLTKSDVASCDPGMVDEVRGTAVGAEVVQTSAVTGDGLDALRIGLQPNRTAALLGSSGVGKSTLINALAGDEHMLTQPTRSDAVGRHTTTHRELVRIDGGGCLIDTPGLRELLAWDGDDGMDAVFGDIEALTERCRFADCAHAAEPGCAVHEALASGELERARWLSYQKMRREAAFLARRTHERRAQSRAFTKTTRPRRER